MEEFNKTVEIFLELLEKHVGSTPTIKINYRDKKITVINSCSSFIKIMAMSPDTLLHMGEDGMSFEVFKKK